MVHESSPLVEQLLSRCLARLEKEGPDAILDVCKDHPDLIPEVQRLLGILVGLGFDGRAGTSPGSDRVASEGLDGIQENLGEFRLLKLLGKGGMGAVYLAEDQELNRKVALKVIRSDYLQEEKARSRFRRETDALARLDHPGLCTIYRAGEERGLPWIAMRYVEGEALDRVIARKKRTKAVVQDPAECLALFEKVGQALQSAHEAGLVHRDLKPGNLLISPEGEPVVLDFGLARDDISDQHLTLSGEQVGTPAYMSPEQARGQKIDSRSDIYSLAVTLFEALTLELPYEGQGREALYQDIVKGRLRRASEIRRGLPAELQIVLDKAMDPDPDHRYPDMRTFVEDLRRVRMHEPIQARRSSAHLRLRRWTQRNPVAATFLLLMGLWLGVSLILLERGNEALRRSHARGYANLAVSLMDDKPLHAVALAARSVELYPAPESLGSLSQALQRAYSATDYRPELLKDRFLNVREILRSPANDEDRFLVLLETPDRRHTDPALICGSECLRLATPIGGAYDADWSPDGSFFVTTARGPLARIWSRTGEALEEIAVPGTLPKTRVAAARFLPDGDRIVFSCNDGILRMYSRSQKQWLFEYPSKLCRSVPGSNPMPITSLDLDPSGRFCVLASLAQAVEFVDLQEGSSRIAEPRERPASNRVRRLAALQVQYSPDGRFVFVHWAGGIARLWSAEGVNLRSWGLNGNLTRGAFSPDGRQLLTVHQDKRALIWNLPDEGASPELVSTFPGHAAWVVFGTFSPDGNLMMTLTAAGVARVWNPRTGLQIARLPGSSVMGRAAAFDRDGLHCLVGGDANRVRRFELAKEELPTLRGTASGIRSALQVPPEWGGEFVTRSSDTTLTLYSAKGRKVRTLAQDAVFGDETKLSPDGKWLAYSSRSGVVRILAAPGDRVASIETGLDTPFIEFGPGNSLFCFEYPKDGKQLFTILVRNSQGRWVEAEEDLISKYRTILGTFWTIDYSEPHALLASGTTTSTGSALDLYDCSADQPRKISSTPISEYTILSLAISPDGKEILGGCSDTIARLWSIDGTLISTLPGHAGAILHAGFSPDGSRLLTSTPLMGLRIWNRAGVHLMTLKPRRGVITDASFLSDGERVLYASTDGTAQVSWARSERLGEEAENLGITIDRNLWQGYDRLIGK